MLLLVGTDFFVVADNLVFVGAAIEADIGVEMVLWSELADAVEQQEHSWKHLMKVQCHSAVVVVELQWNVPVLKIDYH